VHVSERLINRCGENLLGSTTMVHSSNMDSTTRMRENNTYLQLSGGVGCSGEHHNRR